MKYRMIGVVTAVLMVAAILYVLCVFEAERDPAIEFPEAYSQPNKDVAVWGDAGENVLAAGQGTISVVLLGIDSDAYREKKRMGYRSDTIIVLVIDLDNATCKGLSIPRDTRVRVNKLNASGKVVSTRTDRINTALSSGRGPNKYGYTNVLNAINDLFKTAGCDPQLAYYIAVDMDAIAPITQAVGGVALTLDENMPEIGGKAGDTVILDGEKALLYLRKRKGVPGGDIGRTRNQQQFILRLAEQIKERGAVEMVPVLLGALRSDVRTNLSFTQLVALASAMSRADLSQVEFTTLPGYNRSINSKSYYIVSKAKLKPILTRMYG